MKNIATEEEVRDASHAMNDWVEEHRSLVHSRAIDHLEKVLADLKVSVPREKLASYSFAYDTEELEKKLNLAFELGEKHSAGRHALLKEYHHELTHEAEYMGEDGNMVTVSETPNGALIKFKRKVREDCGSIDADEMKVEHVTHGVMALPEFLECASDEYSWMVWWKPENAHGDTLPVYTYNVF